MDQHSGCDLADDSARPEFRLLGAVLGLVVASEVRVDVALGDRDRGLREVLRGDVLLALLVHLVQLVAELRRSVRMPLRM
eukprot:1971752-Rhodomonas_salina.7